MPEPTSPPSAAAAVRARRLALPARRRSSRRRSIVGPRNASATAIFFVSALGVIPTAALMGRATEELAARSGPGSAACSTSPSATRRADHRPVRARQGPAGGRQGVDHRLDPRQRPARAGRRDAGRRLIGPRRSRTSNRDGRERAVDDAAARRRRRWSCRRSSSWSRARACRPRRRAGGLRQQGRAPLAGGRGRADPHLRRRPVLLAATHARPVQPARGGASEDTLRLEHAECASLSSRSRARGRRDVRDPGRLDRGGLAGDRAVGVLHRRDRGGDRRQRRRALGRGPGRDKNKMDLAVNIAIGSSAQVALFVARCWCSSRS